MTLRHMYNVWSCPFLAQSMYVICQLDNKAVGEKKKKHIWGLIGNYMFTVVVNNQQRNPPIS